MGGEFAGIIEIVIGVAALILVIVWLVLPFIVIGMRSRIDRLIELVTINNELALEASRSLDKLASEVETSLKS